MSEVPTFRGTADEVADLLGKYMRKKFDAGASTADAIAMVMRTPDGFIGTAGSRLALLSQLHQMDPNVAVVVALDTAWRPGYVPIIAMDMVDKSHGVEWLGPFPNAPGGEG